MRSAWWASIKATREDAPLLAGKGDEELVSAVRATDPGEAVLQVTALERLRPIGQMAMSFGR